MTERQTNASSGSVVNMFRPKQLVEVSQEAPYQSRSMGRLYNRAMLTTILSDGKLFRTLPWVLDPKDRNPAMPIARHITREIPVE